MCIILVEKTSLPPIHKDWFADFVTRNRDGSGIMVSAGDRVYTEKLLSNDVDKTYEMYLRGREAGAWLAFHARYRTHGAVDEGNLHPYIVNDNLYMMHNGVLSTGYGMAKADHPSIKQRIIDLASTPQQISKVSVQSGYSGLSRSSSDIYDMYDDAAYSRSTYSGVGGGNWHAPQMSEADKAAATFSDTWHYIEDWVKPLIETTPSIIDVQQFRDLIGAHIGANNRFVFATPTSMHIINAKTGVFPSGRWLSNTYAWSGTGTTDLLAPKPKSTTYSTPYVVPQYTGGTGYKRKKRESNRVQQANNISARLAPAIENSAAYIMNKHHGVNGDYWDTVYAGWDEKHHKVIVAHKSGATTSKTPLVLVDGMVEVPSLLTATLTYEKALQVMGFDKRGKYIKARNSIAEGTWEPYAVPIGYTGTEKIVARLFNNASHSNTANGEGLGFSRGDFSTLASNLYRGTTSVHDTMINLETWGSATHILQMAFMRCPLYASFCGLPKQVIASMLAMYVGLAEAPDNQNPAGVAYRLAASAYHGLNDGSRLSPLWFLSLLEIVYDASCPNLDDKTSITPAAYNNTFKSVSY